MGEAATPNAMNIGNDIWRAAHEFKTAAGNVISACSTPQINLDKMILDGYDPKKEKLGRVMEEAMEAGALLYKLIMLVEERRNYLSGVFTQSPPDPRDAERMIPRLKLTGVSEG